MHVLMQTSLNRFYLALIAYMHLYKSVRQFRYMTLVYSFVNLIQKP